jgi:hypothetical protein
MVGETSWAQTAALVPKVGGYLQARETYQDGSGLTASLNRARLSVDGTMGGGFSYRALVEYAAPTSGGSAGVSLRDAYIRWTHLGISVTTGQFKVPFSREYLTSITMLETADRSAAVDALAPKRDLGVMAEYTWQSAVTFSGGLFNGEGQNQPVNRDSTILVAVRMAVQPISHVSVAGNIARSGSDSTRYGMDGQLEYEAAVVRAEYLGERRKGVSRDDRGWYVLAGFRVTPQIQLVVKTEQLERPSLASGSRIQASTGGINLDLVPTKIRLLANYVSRRIGTGDRTGSLITQLQVRF